MADTNLLIGTLSLEKILISVLFFAFICVIANFLYLLLRKNLAKKISKHNAMILSSLVQYTFITLAIYFGIYKGLNLNLSGFAASLGIITLAIAFSSQQLIQNFIAGLIISFQRPVEIGDWIDIGPGTGVSKVKEINLMRIVVRDINGKIHSLANSTVLSSRIINFSSSGFMEIPVQIDIPYDSDYEKIKETILEVVNLNKRVLPNVSKGEKQEIRKIFKLPKIKEMFRGKFDVNMFLPRVFISAINYPKITLEIRFWLREIEKKDEIVSELLDEIRKRLQKEKISLG